MTNCKKNKALKVTTIKKAIVLSLEQGSTRQSAYGAADVSSTTFRNWLNKDDKFALAVINAELKAVKSVEGALYKRAMGYEHPEDKIFCKDGIVTTVPTIKHHPPDTGSLVFFLCNRAGDEWHNVNKLEHTGAVTLKHDFEEIDDDKLDKLIKRVEGGKTKKAGS